MGVCSTLCVTRSKAKIELLKVISGEISDEMIGLFLGHLLEPRLYNAVIVPDETENDDDLI